MSEMIAWIAAQADEKVPNESSIRGGRTEVPVEELPVHRLPGRSRAVGLGEDCYACDPVEEVKAPLKH